MLKYFYSGIIAIALIFLAFITGKNYGANKEIVQCQNKEIKENNKEIKTRDDIVVIKKKQIEIASEIDDVESRKHFIQLWREKRFGNNK